MSLPIGNSHVQLEFRTFSPDGVLFLIDSVVTQTPYYTLAVQNGHVVLIAADSDGKSVNLKTNQTYNDGHWYQVLKHFCF